MARFSLWWLLLSLLIFLNLTILLTPDDSFQEDLGRHLKLGQIISQTHQVPKTNLLSHTMSDERFVNHHWLSQVIFWQVYRLTGLSGLMVLKVVLINGTFLCLFLAVGRRLKNQVWVMLPFFAWAILLFRDRFDLQPELFTYLLIAVFLCLLDKKLTPRRVMLLTFLQLFWVNLHIFFFLGPFLVATSHLRRVQPSRGMDPNLIKKICLAVTPLVAVTLINPNGLVGALFPLLILRGYGYSVVENQSVFYLKRFFPQVNFSLYHFSLLIIFASGLYSVWRRKIDHALWQVAALALSLKMLRGFPLLPLLGLVPVADNLRPWLGSPRLEPHRQNLRLGIVCITIVIAASGLLLLPTKFTRFRFEMDYAGLGDFLDAHPVAGPIFNNYDIGSFLIWKLYPGGRVFVDNRPEAYSKAFFEEIYKPMQLDRATFQTYADRYGIRTIIWSKTDMTGWSNHFVREIILRLTDWETTYEDDFSLVLVKS